MIAKLRAEKGRWVDYIIEFARGIDNLAGYHDELSQQHRLPSKDRPKRLDYYFDVFLQSVKKVKTTEYVKEIEKYNQCIHSYGDMGEQSFFADVGKKYPEFEAHFKKHLEKGSEPRMDLAQFLMKNSDFLNKDDNQWMKSVIEVVRKTSLFLQPQIRTKIMNEGWASYWHEILFLEDGRINGHEVDFARANAQVTALPRVGLNPYALGMRLFYYIEEMANKGKYSFEFQQLFDANEREKFDKDTGIGRDFIFKVRENFCDFMFINTFVDQDFVTRHKLFIAGQKINHQRMSREYYVKSRKAEDYRRMLGNSLYHPPHIEVDPGKNTNNTLYLVHHFEDKPLVKDFIANTMMGIEYLWDGPVKLETSEVVSMSPPEMYDVFAGSMQAPAEEDPEPEVQWQRVLYTMKDRKLSRETIS